MTSSIQIFTAPEQRAAFPSGLVNIDEGRYYLSENIPPSIPGQETSAENTPDINSLRRLLKNILEDIGQKIEVIQGLLPFVTSAEYTNPLLYDFLNYSQRIIKGVNEKRTSQFWGELYLGFKKPAGFAGGVYPSPLLDALKDLGEAREEAREEEYPQPSDLAIANARRLLPQMYEITPRRFEVYPTPDGEIAIDAPGGYGRSVLLLCDSDGGALCLVNTSGAGDRRARYRTTDTLPDGFLREALGDIREYK